MATVVSDQFTDTNGTALPSHAIAPTNPLGLSWASGAVPVFGTPTGFHVSSNAAKLTHGAGTHVGGTWLDVGQASCEITADLTTGSDVGVGGTGLLFWYTSDADYWKCDILANPGMRITHVVSGVANHVATLSRAIANATKYAVTLALDGAKVTFAAPMGTISYTNATAPAGTKHGITANSVGSLVDNFVLTGDLPSIGSLRLSTRTRSRLSLRL